MSDSTDDFDEAYQRALGRCGAASWAALLPKQQMMAIVEELRLMRLERGPEPMNGKPVGGT